MKINNPKVTLADDARVGVKEELRSGFLDWLHPIRAYCRENSILILPEKSTARPSSTLCSYCLECGFCKPSAAGNHQPCRKTGKYCKYMKPILR